MFSFNILEINDINYKFYMFNKNLLLVIIPPNGQDLLEEEILVLS